MIEARSIDTLRFLAVATAFPNQQRMPVVAELARSLQLESVLCQPNQEQLEAAYHRLFSGQHRCSPHETEYGPGRSVRKAVELADIAAFYRAFNLGIDATDPELVDHISLEFDFLAEVGFKQRYASLQGWVEQAEICQKAYRDFWEDHLGRWSPGFLEQLQQLAPEGSFYHALAQFARAFVLEEMTRLGLTPGYLQPDRSEIPAYECLGCADPPQGEEVHVV